MPVVEFYLNLYDRPRLREKPHTQAGRSANPMTRTLIIVAVSVILQVFAAAQAQDQAPPVAQIRAAIEKGEYQEAVKMVSQAERGLGRSARGERYALLMLKGDALQRAGSPAYAA